MSCAAPVLSTAAGSTPTGGWRPTRVARAAAWPYAARTRRHKRNRPRAIGGTSLASVTRASLGESEGHVLAQGMTALGLVRLYNPRGPTKASSKPIHFGAPAEPGLAGRQAE